MEITKPTNKKLERVLLVYSITSSISFFVVSFLIPYASWIGYGYALLYLCFSIAILIMMILNNKPKKRVRQSTTLDSKALSKPF